MGNWVITYCSDQRQKPARFKRPDPAVVLLQESLSRWSGSKLWAEFQGLGTMGKT